MLSLDKRRARNIQMGTLLLASDFYDANPIIQESARFTLDPTLLDLMLERVAFRTAPRAGNLADIFEFVVGRATYYAMSSMEEFEKSVASYPELSVKCGTAIFYKGFPVTTDAMFKPGTWMLPPDSILCLATRTNGSTVIRRPAAVEVDIPTLDMTDVLPVPAMRW